MKGQQKINATLDIIYIIVGVSCATIGLRGFIIPNHFLDGGAVGMSLLANHISGVEVSFFIVIFNLPFIFLGLKQLSLYFTIKTLCAILTLSFLVHAVNLPEITNDKLLTAIFGGIFLGAGIGFAIRGGSVIDGTEILAIYVSKRSILLIGDVIMIINLIIFIIAIFVTDIETAMYAMITYASASRVVNFITHGVEEYTGISVISNKEETMKRFFHKRKRPFTVYLGKGSHDQDINIIYFVTTRLEVTAIIEDIRAIDPSAFIIQSKVDDAKGGVLKQRPLH